MSIIALSGIVVRMQLPDIGHAYAFGFQDRETFLDQHLTIAGAGTYQLLQLLDKDPTVTRVFALPDGARLYTHVRISSPLTSESGRGFHGDDETILRQLRANGYSHILLDRRGWAGPTLGWDTLAVIDEDFLQRHTELVAGGDHNYLYRIVYPDQGATPRGWVTGTELLPNGDFEQFKDGQPTQWELTAGGRVDNHSTTQGGNHVVHLTMGSQLIGSAFVDGGVQYLLASKTQSTKGYGTVQVEIEWRDGDGRYISATTETIPTSPDADHRFSILASAPATAVSARITLTSTGKEAWVDKLSLRVAVTDK